MFEEEHRERSLPETGMEMIVRAHWGFLGVVAAVGAGGNAEWSRGTLGAFGILGPILLLAYSRSPDRSGDRVSGPYSIYMFPAWVTLAVFISAGFFPAYILQVDGMSKFWELLPPPPAWVPVSGPFNLALMEVLLLVGLYASALNALIVPQGRIVFARVWAGLAYVAGLFALLGVAQGASGANDVIWFVPIQNARFFSTFPHSANWCAFAILWMGVSFAMTAWLVRQRSWKWLGADGWMLLGSGLILAISILVAGDPLHWILGASVAAVGCWVLAWQTYADRSPEKRLGTQTLFPAVLGLVLVGCAGLVVYHNLEGGWIKYAGDRPGASWHPQVIEDTLAMWRDRPFFGWGHASFGVVFSFFQQADQGQSYWAFARSDLAQSLAENGVIGTLVWWLPAPFLLWRLFRSGLASFFLPPLVALLSIVVLAVVDFPFASPAVFFAFWFIFFSSTRWNEMDDESTKSHWTDRRRHEHRRTHSHSRSRSSRRVADSPDSAQPPPAPAPDAPRPPPSLPVPPAY